MGRALMGAWQIFVGEMRAALSDRGVVIIILGASMFYALFYPLPYQSQVATGLPVIVVDQDRSASSRDLIRRVSATEQIRIHRVIGELREAEAQVRDMQAAGILVIPPDFERDILRRQPVQVGAYGNAAFIVLYSQVVTGMVNAVQEYSAGIVRARQLSSGRPSLLADTLAEPLAVDLHELYNPDGGYANYIVPAVLVLILQQTFLIGIGMMGAGRRERGASAARGLVDLLARAGAYLLLLALLLGFYLLVVYEVFEFPRFGRVRDVYVLMLPFFLAVIFLGLALGQLFRSRETALQTMMLLSLPAVFLAGFAWPAEVMPTGLVWLGQLIPSTPGIDGFVRVYQMGASLEEVGSTLTQLWLLAGAYLLLAWSTSRVDKRAAVS
ncbi:MAG: ABC transporter permease [Wenzhouxiangella sp.]|jgi:ABC-2 type transport system permease protein|nr:ABC transporter permease [Wenzhouxiangella sp.]